MLSWRSIGLLVASSALAGCALSPSSAPAFYADGRLAAPSGMSLYVNDRDVAGSGRSACGDPCRFTWPPFMASSGDAAYGIWTLVPRDEGGRQWAWRGRPLYLHRNDQNRSDRTGDGVAGVWHLVPVQ